MTDDTVRFVFQIAAVFFGGGAVQLFVFLLRRRAELRGLDAASDATALTSANAYILTLQAGDKVLRGEIDSLKAEIVAMRTQWDTERIAGTEALENANREVGRFRAELARVRADLVVSQSQIAELGARLPGRPTQRYPEDPL